MENLTVPNAAGTGNNQSDTSSCRSVLSDLRRADSVEHIDDMSDIDQNDRLSVDSGMWTPGSGSGGSRHGSGRRTHHRNSSMVSQLRFHLSRSSFYLGHAELGFRESPFFCI